MDWSKNNILVFAKENQVKGVKPNDSDTTVRTCYRLYKQHVTALKFSPNYPNIIAIGGDQSHTFVFDFEKQAAIRKLDGHKGKINSLDWYGDLLAIGAK